MNGKIRKNIYLFDIKYRLEPLWKIQDDRMLVRYNTSNWIELDTKIDDTLMWEIFTSNDTYTKILIVKYRLWKISLYTLINLYLCQAQYEI